MTALGYADSEAVLAECLRGVGDWPTAFVQALNRAERFERTEGSEVFAGALRVVSSVLTYPSRKTVEAQAAELAELVGVLEADEVLDYADVRSEALGRLGALERVSAVLRAAERRIWVPIRGMAHSERPLLVDYIDAFVVAVRAAL